MALLMVLNLIGNILTLFFGENGCKTDTEREIAQILYLPKCWGEKVIKLQDRTKVKAEEKSLNVCVIYALHISEFL